jgi:predicted nucleic acid-binding protein
VTLTLDAENVAALRSLVGARSLSAAVDAAVAERVARLRHLAALDGWLAELDAQHGPAPAETLEWAARLVADLAEPGHGDRQRQPGGRRTRDGLMLLLDSEALSALAHGPGGRRDRARALIAEMRRRELPVATVAAVLAEVVRSRPADASVFGGMRRERVQVHPVDTAVGVRAGQLMGSARVGSELAVDAFVIAVGDLAGGALIATVDVGDLARLAAHANRVSIAPIQP